MTKSILIVEDNPMNMKLFSDLLESHGFNILKSVDGMDTMQLAKEHRPDLIIMDIHLPEVSGLELTKSLKADDDLKYIPVLAVTAHEDEKKVLEAGCDGYMTKPITISGFLDEVQKFLTLAPFRLTDALMIGHPKIDAEHQHIVELLDDFRGSLEAGDDNGCAEKIKQMGKAINSHFENEEKIMEELGYKRLDAHKAHHAKATQKFNALIENADRISYGRHYINKLTAMFVEDFISADKCFKRFLE